MKHKWKNDNATFGMADLTYCEYCNTVKFTYTDENNCTGKPKLDENDLVYRLRKRAEIRRQIPDRKSVQEGKPDRIADILEEAAIEIENLREKVKYV